MNWKKYSIILAALLWFATDSQALDIKEYTKELHETYNVDNGVQLTIVNRYGAIRLHTWDKNTIEIDVKITVKTSSQSRADKVFDIINIDLSGDRHEVSGITKIDEKASNSGWWDKLFGDGGDSDYEISYTIHAPTQVKLDITNKYGPLYINNDIVGDASLTNKYGNIYTENIKGNVSLYLGYGDAKIGNVDDLDIKIKYSDIKVGDASDVTSSSKYSKIIIGNTQEFRSTTKYDNYDIESATSYSNRGKYDDIHIGEVGEFSIQSKYSSILLELVTQSIDLTGKYNGMKVKYTHSTLESIGIEGKYHNIKLNLSHSFSLIFEGDNISPQLPSGFDKVVYIEDGGDVEIKGHKGGKGGTKISANMRYGSLNIYE